MKIYFENGPLQPLSTLDFKPILLIDAKNGYASVVRTMDMWLKAYPNAIVYTNSLETLSSVYSWNEKLKDHDVFMRESTRSSFKRISKLYGAKIRMSQNIRAMFVSGCFGCLRGAGDSEKMKFLITRIERKAAVVEAESEAAALKMCELGLIPEEQWMEDDRPYEYSNDLGEPYIEE